MSNSIVICWFGSNWILVLVQKDVSQPSLPRKMIVIPTGESLPQPSLPSSEPDYGSAAAALLTTESSLTTEKNRQTTTTTTSRPSTQPVIVMSSPSPSSHVINSIHSFMSNHSVSDQKNQQPPVPNPNLDEANCLEGEEWTCNDGLCIPYEKRCDGHFNCYDHSDESFCSPCPTIIGYFHCGNNTSCLDPSKKCNHIIDCWDGSDEQNCPSAAP